MGNTNGLHNRVPSFVSDSSKSVGGTQVDVLNNTNPTFPLYMVPSQFHEPMEGSEDDYLTQIVQKARSKTKTGPPISICYPEVFPVRKLMILDAVREFEDDFEPIYSSADHTLFIYPTSFERFHLR